MTHCACVTVSDLQGLWCGADPWPGRPIMKELPPPCQGSGVQSVARAPRLLLLCSLEAQPGTPPSPKVNARAAPMVSVGTKTHPHTAAHGRLSSAVTASSSAHHTRTVTSLTLWREKFSSHVCRSPRCLG